MLFFMPMVNSQIQSITITTYTIAAISKKRRKSDIIDSRLL